ncbi:hypothetical protein C0J52_12953 [Blattella germanica]|nr:hypothetical protein C0J52_12953 [Blattella germanica]
MYTMFLLYAAHVYLSKEQNHLVLQSSKIALKYFSTMKPVFIICRKYECEILDFLLETLNDMEHHSLQVYNLDAPHKIDVPVEIAGAYIVLILECQQLSTILNSMIWNNRAFFIVFIRSVSLIRDEALCIAQELWNGFKIMNGIIIINMKSFFTSYLVDPGHEKQITDLEELLDSKLRIYYKPEHKRHFEESNYRHHQKIIEKDESLLDSTATIQDLIDNKNLALFVEELVIENYLNDHDPEGAVCLLNEFVTFVLYFVACLKKGSPFL